MTEGDPVHYIPDIPLPRYNEPLTMQGDAAIFPDIEAPYHNADFINRVIDLAQAWNISQAIFAGDFLHDAWASSFEKNWQEKKQGGLDENQERQVMEFMNGLGAKHRADGLALMEKIGLMQPDDNFSDEMSACRSVYRNFADCFERFDLVLGNHEGRWLKVIGTALVPNELLINLRLQDGKWRIGPYYYSVLETEQGMYYIEHPKSAAEGAPCKLADKYEVHIIMGHSHDWSCRMSTSGRYWAIASGHCVDEAKLPYASQRHNVRKAHCLGAVIVRGGYPYLLSKRTDWARMKRH